MSRLWRIQCVVIQLTQEFTVPATLTKESPTRTINVRVPMHVYQQLDELAKATARTKSFVTLEALSTYLDTQGWQVKDIEAGLAEADKGEFATDVQVEAVFAKYGA
jgi:RHH-type rel operon transcriptional repressor/antitoxin RelB